MFLASLALYTWIFTSFLRLKWGLVFFIGIFLVSIAFVVIKGIIQKKSDFSYSFKKILFQQGGAFLIALIAIILHTAHYDPQLKSDFFSFSSLKYQSQSGHFAFQPFLGEVLIKEQNKPDRYLIEDRNGKSYFLKSDKKFQVGTNIHLGASLKAVDYSQLFTELAFQSGFSFSHFFDYQFNYDKWLLMKGVQGTLYEKFSIENPSPSLHLSPFEHSLVSIRMWLKEHISQWLPGAEGGLLLGMLIGDKSQLPSEDYNKFISSGIVHIIAVSGGNLVMIVIFLSALLFFLPFYIRNGVIILSVIAFALLCGGDSSVIRALIMATLSLFALFRGREIQIWRLLRYAFVLMLCYNPFFLSYDLGFLLSFGAIIGIVIASDSWTKLSAKSEDKKKGKIRLPKFLNSFIKNYILPTLGATLGTLPILLFFIGETNLSGVLINIILVPLVPIITIGGFISILLTHRTGRGFLLLPVQALIKVVFRLSDLAIKMSIKISIPSVLGKWIFVVLMLGIIFVVYKIIKKEMKSEKS